MKEDSNIYALNDFLSSMDQEDKDDVERAIQFGIDQVRLLGITYTKEEEYVNQLVSIQSFCIIKYTLLDDDKYLDYLKRLLDICPIPLVPFLEERRDATFMRLRLKQNGVDTSKMIIM